MIRADERGLLLSEWAWQRTAMHHALAYEQFLSPWVRAVLARVGAGAATHRRRADDIEDRLRERGWWDGEGMSGDR